MAKTIEYVLVTAFTSDELARRVVERLGAGWQLYGNPVISGGSSPEYAQALVRDVDRPVQIGGLGGKS